MQHCYMIKRVLSQLLFVVLRAVPQVLLAADRLSDLITQRRSKIARRG